MPKLFPKWPETVGKGAELGAAYLVVGVGLGEDSCR